MAFTAVHIPVKPTQEWLTKYYHEHFDDDPDKNLSFKKYAAYASHMDQAVGKILESLERTCQRENTIIVFSSDNGAINDAPLHSSDQYPGWQTEYPRLGSNAPYRGVKAQLYEGGIRVPTIVNWRGKLSSDKIDTPVQVTDWMPTFLSLTGSEITHASRYDGQDIWSVITGAEKTSSSRRLYWNFQGSAQLGLRDGDWKLIVRNPDSGDDRETELYNIADDPYEKYDRAAEMPDRVADLAAKVQEERQFDDSSARTDVD